MKQLRRFLCLAAWLVGSSTIVTAQNYEPTAENAPKSTLKIKTSVEARGAYDLKNYYAAPDFGAATIPMESDAANSKRVLFDIPDATLSIEKALMLPGEDMVKLVLQAKLKEKIALSSVYAEFKGFRVGKAATNFCDSEGCGLVSEKSVQARWQYKWPSSVTYTVAIEETPDFVIYPEIEKKEDRDKADLQPYKNIPTLSTNLRYEAKKAWHVQLGGLFSMLESHSKQYNDDLYTPAWGINIDAAFHLVPEKTTLKLQGVYGQGIGNYINDLSDLEKEPNTVYSQADNMFVYQTLNAWGTGVNVAHKWLPKLRSEATYKLVATTDSERHEDAYRYGHTATINLFYHPNKQIKVGGEYLMGIRQNISKEWKDAHRLQAVVAFSI
ncbi:MAG: hypothetical protein ACX93T_03980 [Bacteroidota bacterium]